MSMTHATKSIILNRNLLNNMGTSHTKLNGATKPSVSLPKDKSTPLETESSAGKASSRSASIKTRTNGHIHNSHSSSGTASSTNRHLAQYHSCIEFVLSILNIYEVNYKLQLQDILNLLRIPYSDGKGYKSMNGQHDDALFHSLYLTIYNIILLFKFNRVMKENTSFPNIHLIIKYINYELMKMNYPRVLKLISIQNDDELLLLELFNAMNWLILSYNPILIKHVMSRDYLNQNFMNGELPSDHSLYYFLKSAMNERMNENGIHTSQQQAIPPSSSPPLYSQQFQYCGDRSMNHSKDSNLHSLIHQLVMNINKIFMVMSQIYNKSIQSNLLNMECDSIGYTPFELNLLLLNDHSSQLYQLNTFIGSFNHLLQYYEMIINERMIRFEDSRMIPSNGDDHDGGSNSSSSCSNSSNNTSGHGNSSSSNTSGHDHNTSDMINDASNSHSTSNERNESSSFENHTPSIPFLLNSLKSVEKDEEHLQVSYNSLSDTFTHALGKLPIHSRDKYALRNITSSNLMSSTSGSSGSSTSGSSGSGGMNPSHSVFYQIRKHQDENNNTPQRQVSFLSKQHSRHKSPPHHTDSHQSSSSQIYLEMLQHIHDDLLRDIYNSTSSSSSSGTSTTNGDITNDSSTTANNTCRE